MKRSNRLLLALIIAVFAVPGITHVALMARYKRGVMTIEKLNPNSSLNHYTIATPVYVSAAGLHNLTVISSDSASLAIDKDASGKIEFRRTGDSLILRSTQNSRNDQGQLMGSENPVTLHLPSAQALVFDNCHIKLVGAEAKEKGRSYSVTIKDSKLQFGNEGEPSEKSFDKLDIRAEGESLIVFYSSTFVRNLFVQLSGKSILEDQGLSTEKIDGSFAPGTRSSLSGENLNKLNRQ